MRTNACKIVSVAACTLSLACGGSDLDIESDPARGKADDKQRASDTVKVIAKLVDADGKPLDTEPNAVLQTEDGDKFLDKDAAPNRLLFKGVPSGRHTIRAKVDVNTSKFSGSCKLKYGLDVDTPQERREQQKSWNRAFEMLSEEAKKKWLEERPLPGGDTIDLREIEICGDVFD